jgi:hypothetical protein
VQLNNLTLAIGADAQVCGICFVLFCFVLFCFVLFCFVLFCFVLFCFVLFCFVLFCFVSAYSFISIQFRTQFHLIVVPNQPFHFTRVLLHLTLAPEACFQRVCPVPARASVGMGEGNRLLETYLSQITNLKPIPPPHPPSLKFCFNTTSPITQQQHHLPPSPSDTLPSAVDDGALDDVQRTTGGGGVMGTAADGEGIEEG